MTAFREVAEAGAAGEVALVYGEIRRTCAVPYVSSLFRHLATYPGLLPWAWRALGPALASGALQQLAWQRVDVSRCRRCRRFPARRSPASASTMPAWRRSARSAGASPG